MSEQTNGNGKHTVIQHEAAVSATLKLLTKTGGEILFTVRSGATPSQIEAVLDNLVHSVVYATEKYQMHVKTNGITAHATNGNGQAQTQTPGQALVCPHHDKQLKQSKHNENQYYCPAVVGEQPSGKKIYCDFKVAV